MEAFSDERFLFPYQTSLEEELAHLAYSTHRDPNHYRELQFEQIMHNFLREQGHEEEQIAQLTNTALHPTGIPLGKEGLITRGKKRGSRIYLKEHPVQGIMILISDKPFLTLCDPRQVHNCLSCPEELPDYFLTQEWLIDWFD